MQEFKKKKKKKKKKQKKKEAKEIEEKKKKKKKKKKHRSGTTTLIITNEEMNDIMKILQALEYSNILLKRVTKTIKDERKEQKGGFLSILLGTRGATLLGKLLSGKGIVIAGSGNNKGKGIASASCRECKFYFNFFSINRNH